MGTHVDTSEVSALAVNLAGAPGRIQRSAPKVMKRGAVEIKENMKDEFSGHGHAPYVEGSLEFEQIDGLGLDYDIGELDSAGPQWGIAAILAFGTSNNAPVADHTKALRLEVPAILRHLGAAGEDAALGGAE